VYADADWAGDVSRKSTSGCLFEVLNCCVAWITRKQNIVARSSTEAEFLSLSCTAAEFLWLKNVKDMVIDVLEPVIFL
jgi:hypothetical protein